MYWKVLNAKHHGVPQNRERVFLIGIRDDKDNNFQFPIEEQLTKRLKDVLEDKVDEKYFLSAKRIGTITNAKRGIGWTDADKKDTANYVLTGYAKNPTDGEYLKIGAFRGRNPENSLDRTVVSSTQQMLEINKEGVSNTITTVQKDNVVVYNDKRLNETIEKNNLPIGEIKAIDTYNKKVQENAPTLTEPHHNTTRLWDGYRIRRLTPRECFRLMDFPDTFTWPVSDSQAYKQAGNSIVVGVLTKILSILLC